MRLVNILYQSIIYASHIYVSNQLNTAKWPHEDNVFDIG